MTDASSPPVSLLGLHGAGKPAPEELLATMRSWLDAEAAPPEQEVDAVARRTSSRELTAALEELAPDALAVQRARGIEEGVARATLRDVGRKHAHYGVATVLPWAVGILRGDVIEVGRLQVERFAEDGAHGLHIPEAGPLSPAAVDESLARIRTLLRARTFRCTSWILDPVLQEALPDSNLARFAARFTIVGDDLPPRAEGAESVAKFVFRRPVAEVRDPAFAPRSSLERLVAARLRGGLGWREPTGLLSPED